MDEVRSHFRLDPAVRLTARPPDRLVRLVLESHDGRAPGADSEEKHEPVSDIDTVVVDSLKALDPEWPIREVGVALFRAARLTDSMRAHSIQFGSRLSRSRGQIEEVALQFVAQVDLHEGRNKVLGGPRRLCLGPVPEDQHEARADVKWIDPVIAPVSAT